MASGSSKGLQTIYMTTDPGGKAALMFVLPQDQKPFQCGLCSVAFDINRDLIVHVKAHLSTKPFQCGYCKVSYETNLELIVHVNTHQFVHAQEEVSTLQCAADNVQSKQRDPDGKEDTKCSTTKVSSQKEGLMVLVDKGGSLSSDPEIPRQHTNIQGLVLQDKEEAFPAKLETLQTENERKMCEAPTSESRRDAGNIKVMTATRLSGSEIQTLDESVRKFMRQIEADSPSLSGSEASADYCQPSVVSESHDVLGSPKMIAEDRYEKQLFYSPEENIPDQKALVQNSSSCVADQTAGAAAPFADAGQLDSWPLERREDKSINIHGEGQHLQHTASSGERVFRPFACSLCGDSFEDPKFVGQHFRSVHKKGKDQVVLCSTDQCLTDKDTASSTDGSVMDQQTPGVPKLFECYVCEQPFRYRNDLHHHILTFHSENDLRVFECCVCGLRFKLAHHARDHFDARHGVDCSRPRQHRACTQKLDAIQQQLQNHSCTSINVSLVRSAASVAACMQGDPSLTCSALELLDVADYSGALCSDNCNDRSLCAMNEETVNVPSCRNETRLKKSPGAQKRSSRKSEITATFRSTDSGDISIKEEQDSFESLGENASKLDNEDKKQQMVSRSGGNTTDQRTLTQNTSYFVTDQTAGAKPKHVAAQLESRTRKKREGKLVNLSRTAEDLQNTSPEKNAVSAPFVCAVCGKRFQDANHVSVHIQRVHKKGKGQAALFLCDADQGCAEDTTAADGDGDSGGDKHSQGNHFQCQVCERVFKHRHHLRRHASLIHNESELRLFECGVCGHKFKLAHHLKSHFDALHGDGQLRLHQCHGCGQRYTLLHHLKQHTKSCPSLGGLQSMSTNPEDPEDSSVSQKESNHGMTLKPLKEAEKKKASMCHVCGKIMHGCAALKSHMLALHMDTRPFQCQLCPKSFRFKNSLNEHTKTHTKEKPFVCDICGKSFATNCTFKCHRHTHANEKPYQCNICHKGFNSYSGLGTHRLRHREDKRYACDKCGKKFYTSGLLKRHAVTHTDLRPLSCKKCGKTYRSSGSLTYHMTHVHPT